MSPLSPNWLRKIPRPERETVLGLLGLWAIYLVPAALMGLVSGEVWVFFMVGLAIPAFLVAACTFAFVNVALFVLGVGAACRVASWAYHRYLWDRFPFHWRARAAKRKGGPKVGDRNRTAWGLLADAIAGLVLGVGFSGVICVPFLATGLLSGHLLTEAPAALTGLGWTMLAMGSGGAVLCLIFRVASEPLWEMAREKEAELPPPVDDEYF